MTHEKCPDCTASLKNHLIHARMVQEGESQIVPIMSKDQETITPYRCSTCGTLWELIVESGAGGHGRFLHPRQK